MSGKLVKAIKYDGVRGTFSLIVSNVGCRMGLRSMDTYLLVNDCVKDIEVRDIEYDGFWLDSEDQLNNFNILGRIDKKKVWGWINSNVRIFAFADGSNIIAYGCAWSKSYKINKSIGINMNEDESWLGPVFVNFHYRNKGINKSQISSIVKAERDRGVKRIFTAINTGNIPSIISYMRNGFSIIGLHHARKGYFCKNREKLFDLTEDQFLKRKLYSI